jgi:flavin reductase (DIM6/NTAB) family NADH-FMN oxidoreductase RutF
LWNEQWLLLASGENAPGKFNIMTVGWGSLGTMWAKPFALAVVRPSRHTYGFMNDSDTFTLSAFPPAYRDALLMCGTKSGRDTNKVAESGLTPIASTRVEAPGFEEADLIIECKKIYFDDFKPAQFLAPEIEDTYGGSDYHRMFFGEVLAIRGEEKYCK